MAEQIVRVTGRRWNWLPFWKHTVFVTFGDHITWQQVDWFAHEMVDRGFEVVIYKPETE